MNLAVPVTVPEGWVRSAEVRVREKFQGEAWRAVKRREDWDGGGGGELDWSLCEGGVAFASEFLRGMDVGLMGRELVDILGSWLDSRTAFTLCSVARLGFRAGLLSVIQLSLCLMKSLLMFFASRFVLPSKRPLSKAHRHRIARAVPTDRSFPVGQHTRMLPVVGVMSDVICSRCCGNWLRRSRDPSLPVWHLRCV